MARLLPLPLGLGLVGIEPLTGPRTINSGVTTSVGNFTQTFGSPFGAWRFRFAFHAMRGSEFRAYRGWVTSMHGGANATRWYFCDPDMRTPFESGLDVSPGLRWDNIAGQNWSNGEPWSNDEPWETSPPEVPVSAPAARGDTQISLADSFWGHDLGIGEYLGFFPLNLGLYVVTEVIEPGTYRIWPPLRKALTTDDYATLKPTLAMRLENEEAASADRSLQMAENLSVTMVEVFDYFVRDYFAD